MSKTAGELFLNGCTENKDDHNFSTLEHYPTLKRLDIRIKDTQ